MKLNAVADLLQRYTLSPMRMGTMLLGFSVPISVALDNLLLAFILLGVLFNMRAMWQIITGHPVARAAWLLFGMLFLAMFYGETPLREAVSLLGKYVDLAFVPMFMLMLSAEDDRRRAQYAFLAAMGVTLLLSWLVGLEILPAQQWMWSATTADNPAIFRSHITQSNMMAFAVFLALLNFRDAATPGVRIAWACSLCWGRSTCCSWCKAEPAT